MSARHGQDILTPSISGELCTRQEWARHAVDTLDRHNIDILLSILKPAWIKGKQAGVKSDKVIERALRYEALMEVTR